MTKHVISDARSPDSVIRPPGGQTRKMPPQRDGAWRGVHHTAWKQEALGVSWEIQDKLTEATLKIESAGSGSQQIAIAYKN
jgi:hypothetical protein